MKHPYAEVLHAVADGRQVQRMVAGNWQNCGGSEALLDISEGITIVRVAPGAEAAPTDPNNYQYEQSR